MVSFVPSTPNNIKDNYMLILFVKRNKKLTALTQRSYCIVEYKAEKEKRKWKKEGTEKRGRGKEC